MKVIKTSVPDDSLTRQFFPADYTDTFKYSFESQKEITPDDFQVAFWTKPPKWVDWLFSIRNTLVKLVGLEGDKSRADKVEACIRHNEVYKVFSVAGKSENETVLKLSDKHLDAYLSVYIEHEDGVGKVVYAITIVHFHNRLGYIYFNAIRPFHAIVVKGMLTHVIKNIQK